MPYKGISSSVALLAVILNLSSVYGVYNSEDGPGTHIGTSMAQCRALCINQVNIIIVSLTLLHFLCNRKLNFIREL